MQELNEQGMLLNNLYQEGDGRFRANFRHKDSWGYAYGYGTTATEAIQEASKQIFWPNKPKKKERVRLSDEKPKKPRERLLL